MRYSVCWNTGKPMCKISCLMLLLAAVLAAATDPASLPLWPGTPPGENGGLGPERDTTKPTDSLIAGKPVVRLQLAQGRARRGAIGSHELQRQTGQFILPRFHRRKVQTFNDPDACAEQDQVRLYQIVVETAHGEVIDADGLNSGGGEDGGGLLGDVNKILNKFM